MKMKKTILSGNEAIARGAYEAGVRVASAYPGTPSTEILENVVQYTEIDAVHKITRTCSCQHKLNKLYYPVLSLRGCTRQLSQLG